MAGKKKRSRKSISSATTTPKPSNNKRRNLRSGDSAVKRLQSGHQQQHHGEDTTTTTTTKGEDLLFTHDSIVQHISTFLSSKSSSSSSSLPAAAPSDVSSKMDDNDNDAAVHHHHQHQQQHHKGEEPLLDSISHLIQFLEKGPPPPPPTKDQVKDGDAGIVITQEDVATLLLPWSVARLVRLATTTTVVATTTTNTTSAVHVMSNTNELAWRALSCCLDVIISSSLNNNNNNNNNGRDKSAKGAAASAAAGGAAGEESTTGENNSTITSSSSSNESLLSTSLSQSTLNRLIPLAAYTAFSSPTKNDDGGGGGSGNVVLLQQHASNCFQHLAKRYHPSFDNVCNGLLREINGMLVAVAASPSSTTTTTSSSMMRSQSVGIPTHQTSVICATLQTIHTLMSNANHKRLFGILSSMDVLSRLGRLAMVTTIGDDKQEGTNGAAAAAAATSVGVAGVSVVNVGRTSSSSSSPEQLVRQILWEGLFHPTHHMDGFRTMSELVHTMPVALFKSFAALGEDNGGDRVGDGDGNDNEQSKTVLSTKEGLPKGNDKKKKSVGGGKMTCFQSNIFTSLQSLLSLEGEVLVNKKPKKALYNDATAIANLLPMIAHGFFERIRVHAVQQQQRMTNAGGGGGGGGGLTSEADAKLQFRFWCHIMAPALEQLFRHPPSSSMSSTSGNDDDDDGNNDGKLLTLALLKATSQTLGLLLEYDAYLPSYGDPKEEHLGFLEYVTKGLLQCIDHHRANEAVICDGEDESDEIMTQSLLLVTSLRHILLLNHRLLHERLAHVISFACSCLSSSSSSSATDAHHHKNDSPSSSSREANALMSAVVKTYRELRQVGYFLTSARGAFASAAGRGGDLTFMNNLLNCTNIMESLSMAYQSCPSGQLHEIWEFFDGWIVDIVTRQFANENGESSNIPVGNITATASSASSPTTVELSFAVQMFIVFIKNIRANKQNSPELRSLCEMSVKTSISNLLGKTPDISTAGSGENHHGILMRQGFDLCGWLVDLHTRSCFWIDSINVDGHGSSFLLTQYKDDDANANNDLNVLAYLRDVAKSTASTEQFKTWKASWLHTYWQSTTDNKDDCLAKFHDIGIPLPLRGSLQRLAFHRIHQLHSMIYYCNLQENERHAASDLEDDHHSSSQTLTDEARMLVDFSLYIACSQITRQLDSGCNTTDESSESLWSPVAQSLCIWTHYSDPFHAELFLIWFFSTLCQKNTSAPLSVQAFRLEKTIALTLSRDAAFYDVSEVMSLFMKVGIQFAFSRFLDTIDATGNPSQKITQESSGLTVSCMELAAKGNAKLSFDDNVDTVSTALSFLASVPLELALCNDNLNLLDRAVGLDILSSQVIKQLGAREGNDPQLLNIIRSTKSIIANMLPKTLLLSSEFDAPCLANLTGQLSKSCFDFRFDDGILFASATSISEYFSMCIDYHEKNSGMLVNFFSQMEALVASAATIDFVSNSLLIRSVIRRINILDRHNHSLSKKTTSANPSSYESCMNFVQKVQRRLQDIMFQHLAKVGSDPECIKAAATALLLFSEILSFFGNHLVTTPVTKMMTNDQKEASMMSVRKVFELIKVFQGSKCCVEIADASIYFLSSMAAAPGYFLLCVTPSSALEHILEALALSHERGKESPLLDAALCSLIRNSDLEQTRIITTHVLRVPDGDRRRDSAFVIKIFHLLMTCANNQEQNKHISGRSKTFLLVSMDLLRDRRCSRSRFIFNVDLFSKTMTTLISKKELLLFSGREIAMICCEMNPLFNDTGFENNDVNGDIAVFKSCCSVVASLIANYPKQLYGCPSPLFSLLLALLSHILRTNAKKDLSRKALEYAKVCELLIPHKDVFKKHVVGLVLRYIQALREGMNPTTKSKLMPSIYSMLDMCSDFETRQINAMIDVPSKTLFAPVFQSYQKFYQYHGQA